MNTISEIGVEIGVIGVLILVDRTFQDVLSTCKTFIRVFCSL